METYIVMFNEHNTGWKEYYRTSLKEEAQRWCDAIIRKSTTQHGCDTQVKIVTAYDE